MDGQIAMQMVMQHRISVTGGEAIPAASGSGGATLSRERYEASS